jgi:hypothetical protein
MSTLPSPGSRRVPFTRSNLPTLPVHLYDRSNCLNENNSQPPTLKRDKCLQNFIWDHSNSRSLKLCSDRYPCLRRDCPWCDSRLAANAREAVRPVSRQFSKCLTFTSTVRTDPSLVSAFDSHASTIRFFLDNGWLSKRTAAWFRESHVTYRDGGWHVHVHWVLFSDSDEDLATLCREIKSRWLTAAYRAGTTASPQGQHLDLRKDVTAAIRYATKGNFKCSGNGQNIGEMWARFQAGEVEGEEQILEIELLLLKPRRRWQERGGRFRGSTSRKLGQ